MMSEDGHDFVKRLATLLRKYEHGLVGSPAPNTRIHRLEVGRPPTIYQKAIGAIGIGSNSTSNAQPGSYTLSLTPHHLYYILSQLKSYIKINPRMDIRAESVNSCSSASYVSFLNDALFSSSRPSDAASIRSVSSIRTTFSTVSGFIAGGWNSRRETRADKTQADLVRDLNEIHRIFSSLKTIQIGPDDLAPRIKGYAEYPFDLAVPVSVFKEANVLELYGVDARAIFGWDGLADRLFSLSLRNVSIADPAVVIVELTYDDAKEARLISPKRDGPYVPPLDISTLSSWLGIPNFELTAVPTPSQDSDSTPPTLADDRDQSPHSAFTSSTSSLLTSSTFCQSHVSTPYRIPSSHSYQSPSPHRRPGSASFNRSIISDSGTGIIGHTQNPVRRPSASSLFTSSHISGGNCLVASGVPLTKWRQLRHLQMTDNGFTNISSFGLLPLANTLEWLDLSSNMFTEVPSSLAILTKLTTLSLYNCQISSLRAWATYPLLSLTTLNLSRNKLASLEGIETLQKLKRVDVSHNCLLDPQDIKPLTHIPTIQRVVVTGNPFTKTRHDYRVAIFSLFRFTPGYKTDIKVDSSTPSASELKALPAQVCGTHSFVSEQLSNYSTGGSRQFHVPYLSYEAIARVIDREHVPRYAHNRSRSDLGLLGKVSNLATGGSNHNSLRRRPISTRPALPEMASGTGNGSRSTRPLSAYFDASRSPGVESCSFFPPTFTKDSVSNSPSRVSQSRIPLPASTCSTSTISSYASTVDSPKSMDRDTVSGTVASSTSTTIRPSLGLIQSLSVPILAHTFNSLSLETLDPVNVPDIFGVQPSALNTNDTILPDKFSISSPPVVSSSSPSSCALKSTLQDSAEEDEGIKDSSPDENSEGNHESEFLDGPGLQTVAEEEDSSWKRVKCVFGSGAEDMENGDQFSGGCSDAECSDSATTGSQKSTPQEPFWSPSTPDARVRSSGMTSPLSHFPVGSALLHERFGSAAGAHTHGQVPSRPATAFARQAIVLAPSPG